MAVEDLDFPTISLSRKKHSASCPCCMRGFCMHLDTMWLFLVGVFQLWEEAGGQRKVHEHLWDTLSPGMSSCESSGQHSWSWLVVSSLATLCTLVLDCTDLGLSWP